MPFDPSLTALRALKSLEITGSVSRTAQELGLTQSAVSRSIANMEKAYGLRFFRRDIRPLELTEEGQIAVSHAHEIDKSVAVLGERLEAFRRNKAGSVRIGSFGASASTHLLPKLLQDFKKYYTGIELSIQEDADQDALQALQENRVDVSVIRDPGESFDTIILTKDRLVALIPENDKLALSKNITQSMLADKPFIFSLGGSGPAILKWFDRKDVEPLISHRIHQTYSILAMVRAGLGYSIVSSLSIPKEIEGIKLLPLNPISEFRVVLARKPLEPRSKAASLFWDFIEK
ncbi:MAG: LysR family transcriptional regulator, partial [Oceanospirillaceae bacterium]